MIEKRETYFGTGLKWFAIMIFLSFIFVLVVDGISDERVASDIVPNLAMLSTILVIGFVLWRSWQTAQRIKGRQVEFVELAAGSGYDVGGEEPGFTTLFRTPEQRDARYINTLSSRGWRYGDFTYNIYRKSKSGEHKAVEVYYSVLELELPRKLPHLFFDAPGARGLQFIPHLDESQRTSLEGDFDQYFVTYFPLHYHIDARSIISPEVMTAMIDSGVSDIEISGDKLYLYSAMMPVRDIPKFVEEGRLIQKRLSDHVAYYRDERVADKSGRKEVSIFGESLRRRPRFPWFTILFCSILLGVMFFHPQMKDNLPALLLLAAIYSAGIVAEVNRTWWKVRQANKRLDRRYAAHAASSKNADGIT